jgi:hypothetical protein
MKTTISIISVLFGLLTYSAKAQNTEANNPKRLQLQVNFGTGHAQANTFYSSNIADFGYSTLSALEAFHFDLGYVLNERFSIVSGFGIQNMSVGYVFENETFRFNGARGLIPLALHAHLGPKESPGKIIFGAGGYYAFDSDDVLVSDDDFFVQGVFNGFGLWTTIGFSYAISDDAGFSVAINSLSDFSADVLRINSRMLSFGYYVRFF